MAGGSEFGAHVLDRPGRQGAPARRLAPSKARRRTASRTLTLPGVWQVEDLKRLQTCLCAADAHAERGNFDDAAAAYTSAIADLTSLMNPLGIFTGHLAAELAAELERTGLKKRAAFPAQKRVAVAVSAPAQIHQIWLNLHIGRAHAQQQQRLFSLAVDDYVDALRIFNHPTANAQVVVGVVAAANYSILCITTHDLLVTNFE